MPDRRRAIEVEFLVDDRDKSKLDNIGQKAGITSRGFDTLKGAVGGFVAAIGAREVFQFGMDAAYMAEQAQIAGENAEKVLGPALQTVHDRLGDVRGVMGFTTADVDTLSGKFGLLTEGMGLNNDEQADLIATLIETGGELAAFRGDVGLSDEAVDALGATMRGEYDSLEQFGVKISDAAVEERKLELKADDANASLSDQELEVLALISLIREKAQPAIGSLQDAEETLAGKTNKARVRFDELKTQLGERLLPVMSFLVDELLETFDAWDRLVNDFENTQLGAIVADIKGPIEDLVASFESLIDIVGDAIAAVDEFFTGNPNPGVHRRGPTPPGSGSPGGGFRPRDQRAIGGDVEAGGVYQINERGQEVFVPNSAGTIVPAGRGAGTVINITINALDPNASAKAVIQAIQTYERNNGNGWRR